MLSGKFIRDLNSAMANSRKHNNLAKISVDVTETRHVFYDGYHNRALTTKDNARPKAMKDPRVERESSRGQSTTSGLHFRKVFQSGTGRSRPRAQERSHSTEERPGRVPSKVSDNSQSDRQSSARGVPRPRRDTHNSSGNSHSESALGRGRSWRETVFTSTASPSDRAKVKQLASEIRFPLPRTVNLHFHEATSASSQENRRRRSKRSESTRSKRRNSSVGSQCGYCGSSRGKRNDEKQCVIM